MILARQYNLFPGLDDASPIKLLLIDYEILGRVIAEENEAQKKYREESERNRRMPGVTRFVSAAERSEQLAAIRAQS